MDANDAVYAAAERRIEMVALAAGVLATAGAAALWGMRAGAGVAAGAALSWLNFRWMKLGVATLARLSRAQEGAAKVRVPRIVYFKFAGRYALLFLGGYVILARIRLPAASLLAGFASAPAAAIVEGTGQIFRGWRNPPGNP